MKYTIEVKDGKFSKTYQDGSGYRYDMIAARMFGQVTAIGELTMKERMTCNICRKSSADTVNGVCLDCQRKH